MAEEENEIPYQVQYDGEEETGEFLTKDGKAKISYPNGDVYEGTYLNGLRHGEGSYSFASQSGCYTGSWIAGSKNGKGEFKYPNGSRYKGGWKSDKRNGKGTYYYANGDIYCGDWDMGKKTGHGSYVNAADGSKLVGTWSEGKMTEGDWEMTGAKFTGKFENGQPVGQGTMKFIVEETLAHVEEGEYVEGKWVCSSKNKVAMEKKYRSERRAYQSYDSKKDYPDFSKSNNWMSKCMTPELYEKFRNIMTKNGYTLDMAIQTGVDNPSHPDVMAVGVTAGDEETYTTFKDIFDPIISGRHNGYPEDFKQPTCLDPTQLTHEGFDEKYVLSSHVRASRSVRGFCMPTFCSRGERRKVEEIFKEASAGLSNYREDLAGHYECLPEMTEERHEELVGRIFDKPIQPQLVSGGLARDWPDARGAFLGDQENFTVWVNEQDHCGIISTEKNGNMKEAFERFCSACNGMEQELKKLGHEYMQSEHLGYISACPTNLGTAMRAGAQVKIPLLSKHEKFGDILSNLRIQKCATCGASEVYRLIFQFEVLYIIGFCIPQFVWASAYMDHYVIGRSFINILLRSLLIFLSLSFVCFMDGMPPEVFTTRFRQVFFSLTSILRTYWLYVFYYPPKSWAGVKVLILGHEFFVNNIRCQSWIPILLMDYKLALSSFRTPDEFLLLRYPLERKNDQ